MWLAGWKTHPLSYARRLTFIKSILQGCYIFWYGIFGFLGKIKQQIESLFVRFLWVGPELAKKIHLVSWEAVCKPYEEEA